MKKDIELTQEEVNELVNLYNSQLVEIETLKAKADMYEEWALHYKKQLDDLKKLVKEYELEFVSLTNQVKDMNKLMELKENENE